MLGKKIDSLAHTMIKHLFNEWSQLDTTLRSKREAYINEILGRLALPNKTLYNIHCDGI